MAAVGEVEEADVVVVGAGSAGCVIAARLSERADLQVAVIEAGGSDLNLWVRMPIGYGGAFHHPRLNWRFQSEPEAGFGGRRSYWPRGKVVGGSSSINAMVFVRGQAEDYDLWAAAGNPGWGYADLLPLFRRSETFLPGPDQWRGGSGPITVRDVAADAHPLSHAFVAAGAEAGFPKNPDFSGASQEGVGFYQINTRDGMRCSAATGYLNPALKRSNLRLVKEALATRILFDGRRAVGVEYRRGGETRRLMARREVILSAGAVGSPHLLQISGVGDPERLAAIGVAPALSRAAVGRNLQDHVGFDFVYEARVPTLNATLGPIVPRMLAGLRWLIRRDGPLSLSINQAGGFIRSRPERTRPDLQLYFSPLSYTKAIPGKRRLTAPDTFPGFRLGISNCHPESRGWLHARSADAAEAPEIRPEYFSAPADLDLLVESAAILRRIAAQKPLADLTLRELAPGPGATDREALVDFIRRDAGSIFHPCGTCAMGPDPAQGAVVDARLRAHGLEGLRIADASIIPTIPSGNINATAIMIGEKAAELLAEDLRAS